VATDGDIHALHRRLGRLRTIGLGSLGALAAGCVVASVSIGAVPIEPGALLAILANALSGGAADGGRIVERTVLLDIRLPRAVLGAAVGAALATAGAALQGLFRNPLADPGLIGVSSGAALAAGFVIVAGAPLLATLPAVLDALALPLAAFAGGLFTTLLVYRIASRDGHTEVATMLLAGVALNAITAAGIGLLVFLSNDQELRDLNFWMLGSLGGVAWPRLLPALPLILLPVVALPLMARHLNAMLLGESAAGHLGFDIERAKRRIVVLSALTVGAGVALTGIIGFIGLVVPHLVRLLLGPDHRTLLPASALLGAALMLLADLVARTVVLPAELPIGIVTSCIGGPFFLWLLVRRRAGAMW
jgi:iron complex transport system permease protein